ncbi:hypothetical protein YASMINEVIRUS_394 [Yasminevirus sp. GU-2018]|uniref:Uncharacterized protein n=1 Tax=Yasminevirus sp. GU-2018 TaxID=2420051 RepID=A0A5K0U8R8_9VIRU|nr:hypothetical protein YASMINEVIRUS_394 [Yasminevirus sp. GU-2018]
MQFLKVVCLVLTLLSLTASLVSTTNNDGIVRSNLSNINPHRVPTPKITVEKQYFYGTVADNGAITIVPILTIPISERLGLPCFTFIGDQDNHDILKQNICTGWHFLMVMIIATVLLCSVV